MAAATARTGVNSIWLLPSAMTLVAFYKNIFEFGNLVVELCRTWLDFCRAFWTHLFALAPGASGGVDTVGSDMLTLWVTSSVAIWLFPLLTRDDTGNPKTAVAALGDLLPLPPFITRLIAFVLIGVSALVIATPFAIPPAQGGPSLIDALQGSQVIEAGGLGAWLSSEGVWAAFGFVGAGVAMLSYVFFVIGPKLAGAQLSDAEKRDLMIISAILWFVSLALLICGLTMADGVLAREDFMVLSLIVLIGLVAWRSALPFVQLAVLIVAIFTIDVVYRFLLEVWTSMG